ncbi:FUSC family protein [Paraburkholderia dinghuensis]|uniref:FUSC family protein n=1 Tax=Paraburkholderia dinghuensis TaxID=2305225 RepID=A0A3N6MWW3_9BURK|nr:FUSC family protein [Paraburkholderia dinghuensis]RQH08514.1 FUSC family protein [Paraburkholderia dinghuensis]
MAHSESDSAAVRPAPPLRRRRSRISRIWHALASPYYRYRNARLVHSIRVGLAMMVSILATTGIDIPHGIWSSVTVLVVIGGLQHHGNIRKKAAERSVGTLLGAGIGLVLIVVQAVTESAALTYLLMSIVAGVCAWHAIGKAGYVGLLTAITMCIVAGHGDNLIDVGLWRTLNVMIGIVIAVAFSFALPLHATYSWRYRLADNLRECARIYAQVAHGEHVDGEEQIRTFMRLNERLVQLRALMPSVAKEIDVPLARLEHIQRLHRSLLSALEMMSMGMQRYEQDLIQVAFAGRGASVRVALLQTARALRFGGGRHPEVVAGALGPSRDIGPEGGTAANGAGDDALPESAAPLAPEMQGPYWLGLRVEELVDMLRALLLETEPHWNIERTSAHRPA